MNEQHQDLQVHMLRRQQEQNKLGEEASSDVYNNMFYVISNHFQEIPKSAMLFNANETLK